MPTLAETKLHLRVDGEDEDSYIAGLINAAEMAVTDYLDLDPPELPDSPAVLAAVLLLVGALYENREALTDRPMSESPVFVRLLAPYRRMLA